MSAPRSTSNRHGTSCSSSSSYSRHSIHRRCSLCVGAAIRLLKSYRGLKCVEGVHCQGTLIGRAARHSGGPFLVNGIHIIAAISIISGIINGGMIRVSLRIRRNCGIIRESLVVRQNCFLITCRSCVESCGKIVNTPEVELALFDVTALLFSEVWGGTGGRKKGW